MLLCDFPLLLRRIKKAKGNLKKDSRFFFSKLTRFPVVSIPDLRQDSTSDAAHLLFPVSCQPSDSVGFPLWGQRPLFSTHLPNITNCENWAHLTRLKNSQGKFRFALCPMFRDRKTIFGWDCCYLVFPVVSLLIPIHVGILGQIPHQQEPASYS